MPDNDIERDLPADLKLLTAIQRDPEEESDLVHDVVAPLALRRAIAAEEMVKQLQAELERLTRERDFYKEDRDRCERLERKADAELIQSREENKRLQQKLADYEGCKGIEEFYAVRCKLRDCQAETARLMNKLQEIDGQRQFAVVEIDRLRELYEREREIAERMRGELDDAYRELDKIRSEFDRLDEEAAKDLDELEQIKAERDDYRKALEWYASKGIIFRPGEDWDVGHRARSVLARYKEGDSQ